MVLQQGVTHLLALLFIRQPAHGRLEEEDAKDGKHNDKFENDEPNERLAPGHVPEAVPVKGGEKGNDAAGAVHPVVSLYKLTNSFPKTEHNGRGLCNTLHIFCVFRVERYSGDRLITSVQKTTVHLFLQKNFEMSEAGGYICVNILCNK